MQNLLLNKPAQLKAITPLKVFRGVNLFYKAKKKKIFTLPPGTYKILGNFDVLNYNFLRGVSLPIPEFNQVKNYAFYYGENPHKATVWDNGDVLISEDLSKLEIIDLLLKLHEIAHSHYTSELNCDLFAIEILKNYGYNDSQIIAALKTIGKTDRFKCIHNKLKK